MHDMLSHCCVLNLIVRFGLGAELADCQDPVDYKAVQCLNAADGGYG